MNYEQKYKEAIERLKQWDREHPNGYSIQERDEFIFPELKEGEDEKIRGKIIATIHLYYGEPLEDEAKEMIAWLEKQGEQKSVPKFKVGDVVHSSNGASLLIVGITDYCYNCVTCANNDEYSFGFDIQDEFKLVEQKPANWFQELEDKLANATPKQLAEWKEKYFKEEPAEWSDEDESIVLGIEQLCNCASLLNIAPDKIDKIRTWFKSLKDRVVLQPKQEWSEEDEKMIESCIFCFEKDLERAKSKLCESDILPDIIDGYKKKIDWLKSLRPQNRWKPTKGQIITLEDIVNTFTDGLSHQIDRLDYPIMKDLLEQLKAL